MRVRGFAAGVVAVGLMVSLSGCGSDSGGGGEAAAALTQANFSQTVTAAQQGAKSAHLEATLKGSGQTVSISGDVAGLGDVSSATMDLKINAAGKQLEMRLVHKVLYMHGGGLPVGHGKSWLKVDLNDPHNPLSNILDTAGPRSLTTYLQAVKSLRDRGEETVDGVKTHHYTVTIDTMKAMAANPAMKGIDLSKLGLPKTLTTDVWVDSANRPVKMTVVIGKLASVEAHLSKYGEPVSVQAPPASQVGKLNLGG
jgi:LppX_LprAFG lipoprotein